MTDNLRGILAILIASTAYVLHDSMAKLLSEDLLQAVAKAYLDRSLDAHELEHLTNAVSDAYRRAGWVVRVYIPQQDLSQNDLIVQILENSPSSAR